MKLMNKFLLTMVVMFGMAVAAQTATVTFVKGDVFYKDAEGKEVSLKVGDTIPEGVTVHTGEDSSVKFTDSKGVKKSYGAKQSFKMVSPQGGARRFVGNHSFVTGSHHAHSRRTSRNNPANTAGAKRTPFTP